MVGSVALAGVVQQQGEIQQFGTFQPPEHLRVRAERGALLLPDVVQPLETHQRVLVGGELVEELVLHLRRDPLEGGDERPRNGPRASAGGSGHLAPLLEDLEKHLAHHWVAAEAGVTRRD